MDRLHKIEANIDSGLGCVTEFVFSSSREVGRAMWSHIVRPNECKFLLSGRNYDMPFLLSEAIPAKNVLGTDDTPRA